MRRETAKSAFIGVACAAMLGVGAGARAHDGHEEGPTGTLTGGPRYLVILNAGQVVAETPSTSNASGLGFLTFDAAESELCYTVTFSDLEGVQLDEPNAAHVHGPAGPGHANHGHVAVLPSGSPLNGCTVIAKEAVKWLRTGSLYLQIHTDLFPSGEIRGQIVPVK